MLIVYLKVGLGNFGIQKYFKRKGVVILKEWGCG